MGDDLDEMCKLLLLFGICFAGIGAGYKSESIIAGSREPCSNEGETFPVDNIKDLKCFNCICKNGFVECQPHYCPQIEGCYMMIPKPIDGCCKKCKGCIYRGKHHPSHTEWTEPGEPCRMLRCEGGVTTISDVQCYTPCASHLPPLPGRCCPTCPGCRLNGHIVHEGREVATSEDPCVKCRCEDGRMTCQKRSCPVLMCPPSRQMRLPGECCPHCVSNRLFEPVPGSCIVGTSFYKNGETFKRDSCTSCSCQNETAICHRPTCPVLECPREYQRTDPEACCPHCPPPEESRTTCAYGGTTYKDGETWQIDPCRTCICNDGKPRCAFQVCEELPTPCPQNTRLVHAKGQCCPKCVEEDGVCTVFGDPHYKTFDGKFFSFQGACKYLLTSDCANGTFSVRVINDARGTKSSSWTKTVTLKMADLKVNLGRKLRVKINGVRVETPYHLEGKVDVNIINESVSVATQAGVKMFWDGNSFLKVSVPSQYKGRLCGLCGNFNSKVQDDFTDKTGKLLAEGDAILFGNSWAVGGRASCSRLKEPPARIREQKCRQRWLHSWKGQCKLLKSSKHFGACGTKLNPSNYLMACLADMCECPTFRCYCDSFAAYAHECQRLGVGLPEWKRTTGCDARRDYYFPTTRRIATNHRHHQQNTPKRPVSVAWPLGMEMFRPDNKSRTRPLTDLPIH